MVWRRNKRRKTRKRSSTRKSHQNTEKSILEYKYLGYKKKKKRNNKEKKKEKKQEERTYCQENSPENREIGTWKFVLTPEKEKEKKEDERRRNTYLKSKMSSGDNWILKSV